jgi:hypothetical protein
MKLRVLQDMVTACGLVLTLAGPGQALDLEDPAERLEAYVKAVGDTSGREVVTYGKSTVYAFVPGEKARPLFAIEIVGVSRYERIDGGYQRLHREVGYYTDLKTGAVLERWYNPFTEREVDVIHIQNDPVNRRFTLDAEGRLPGIRYTANGDEIVFYREIPLRYPNALPRAEYPRHSHGDWYEAMELFNTFARRSELDDPRSTSVHAPGSWSRIGPWLPWMEMGNSAGWLVYHGRSFKPENGLAGIPAPVRAYLEKHHPEYAHAPEKWQDESETSWTVFKKVLDERKGKEP